MQPTAALHPRILVLTLLLGACATPPASSVAEDLRPQPASRGARAQPVVEHWGAMRDVLRDGHTEGRVHLSEVVGPHTIAVGALAGLAAEITIDKGAAHLAEIVIPGSADGLRVRTPVAGEQATLLVLANVREWTEHTLPEVSDLAALEASVRAVADAEGIDVTKPFPFRVECVASELRLHVLDHSCPIANPNGPKPWTFSGSDATAVLIGFHAEDSAGRLTHHGQNCHIHAVLTGRPVSGHLDGISLPLGARLFLPYR